MRPSRIHALLFALSTATSVSGGADTRFPPQWKAMDDGGVAQIVLHELTKDRRAVPPEHQHLAARIPDDNIAKWRPDEPLVLEVSYHWIHEPKWRNEVNSLVIEALADFGLSLEIKDANERTSGVKISMKSSRRDELVQIAEACWQDMARSGPEALQEDCYAQMRTRGSSREVHSGATSSTLVAASLVTGEIYELECDVSLEHPLTDWQRGWAVKELRLCLSSGLLAQHRPWDPIMSAAIVRVVYDPTVLVGVRGDAAIEALTRAVAEFRRHSP